jgi:hypothetical protein
MHKEEIIINLCTPNVSAHNFIKHIVRDLKLQMDPNAVVLGDFNTSVSQTVRPSRQENQQRNHGTK